MSDRALTYVAEFSGTNGDSEVWKSTPRTPYWESIGRAFLRVGFTYKVRWIFGCQDVRLPSFTLRRLPFARATGRICRFMRLSGQYGCFPFMVSLANM